MGRRVRVFVNARSGAGEASGDHIAQLFAQRGCECSVTSLAPGLDLSQLARTDPEDVVFFAAGGDGTVNAVAHAVTCTGRRMGVLPVGTLNHFAKDLGLPLELEDAVAVATGDATRSVDAAEVNGLTFVNNSSLGAYPAMVLDRERMKKDGRAHWASLIAASARAFVRFRRLPVELEIDGQTLRSITPFLFVGNNEYCLDGMRLGKRDHLDRGVLSLYLAPGASRLTMLRLCIATLTGRMKTTPEFQEFKVTHFTVNVRGRKLRVSLDGEVKRLRGPLTYQVRAGALQVLSPAEKPQ